MSAERKVRREDLRNLVKGLRTIVANHPPEEVISMRIEAWSWGNMADAIEALLDSTASPPSAPAEGEPSDEQLDAAVDAWFTAGSVGGPTGAQRPHFRERMRAALRILARPTTESKDDARGNTCDLHVDCAAADAKGMAKRGEKAVHRRARDGETGGRSNA